MSAKVENTINNIINSNVKELPHQKNSGSKEEQENFNDLLEIIKNRSYKKN